MVRVEIASSIARHIELTSFDASSIETFGGTVGEVLDRVFEQHARLRSYVMGDQGSIRKHVTLFVNDRTIMDREGLSDTVQDGDCVYIFQALSGG